MIPALLLGAGLGAGVVWWLDARRRRTEPGAADEAIASQVRGELVAAIERPRAITVAVEQGVVTLTGQVLAREVDNVLHAAESVRGVQRVENRLEVLADERRSSTGRGVNGSS